MTRSGRKNLSNPTVEPVPSGDDQARQADEVRVRSEDEQERQAVEEQLVQDTNMERAEGSGR
jgi:hypothetical protein